MKRMAIPDAKISNSDMSFYYPPTLMDDFTRFLYTDIPHANYTFEVIKDWFKRDNPDYVKKYIRASYLPINWKSKIGNTDANSNFKTNYEQKIHKGDIVIREDGMIYILNWKVQDNPNNQTTQAIDYNHMLSIERWMPRELDPMTGMLVNEAHIETIFPEIPSTLALYAGRPDFATNYNTPGINADNLVSGQIQANSLTKQMHIGDEFDWEDYRYRIIDVYHTEVDPITGRGLLNFNARRVAGAFDGDEDFMQ